MAKQLTVAVSSPTSEVAKDQAVAAAMANVPGLTKGAANIQRDANGRVVQVLLTLPDSAAIAAKNAIAATPGVANVVVGDIIPGTTGFDSTAAGEAAFIAEGNLYQLLSGATEVFNADGTVTYTLPNGSTVQMTGQNDIPVYPIAYSVEWRISLPGMGAALFDPGTVQMQIDVHDGQLNTTAQLATYDLGGSPFLIQGSAQNAFSTATTSSLGTGFHVYRLDFTGTKILGFVDGVQVASITVSGLDTGTNNSINIQINSLADSTSAILDYIRWTSM